MKTCLFREGLADCYAKLCADGTAALIIGVIHADVYLALDFLPIAISNKRVLSSDFYLRDKTSWVQDTLEEVFNKKASVLLGSITILGLLFSLDESKEASLGGQVMKVVQILKHNQETAKEKVFILNAQTKHLFSYDLGSNYLGTNKYSEFNAKEKILKANLKLQTKFVLQMDFTDSDWEDKACRMIIDNLRGRKFMTEKGTIVSTADKKKFDASNSATVLLTLLRSQQDQYTLIQETGQENHSVKVLHLNLFLESYQSRDCYFDTILKNLCSDFERTLIERIFTNLDADFTNLSKRAIVVPGDMFLGQPVYVLPGEDLKCKIAAYGYKEQDRTTAEEAPYGAASKKLISKTLADPVIVQTARVDSTQQNPRTSGPIPEPTPGTPSTSKSFEANNKEKVFVLIVLVTVLMYLYFKFFK